MTVAGGEKEAETGNIALLIAAYLTLNTSLNLLNKVSGSRKLNRQGAGS